MCEVLVGIGIVIMIFAVPFLIVGIFSEEWSAAAGAVIAILVGVLFIGAGGAIYEAKAEANQHEQHYEQKYEEPQCTCGCICHKE